ncbi:MAG: ATP-binding protein [Romboutsia sp.]|uniref:ATP-binding protein n=1 Tax=Romboutsia sp. TaxID=1965302 RepID=UPI003F3A172E
MENINTKEGINFSYNNKIAINLITSISFIIGVVYIGILFLTLNTEKINTEDIIMFIKIFEVILAFIAIVSCILCYNSTKKEELFIISLMYIVFFIDILLGNVDKISFNSSTMNINDYIMVATSLIRIAILAISISPLEKLKKLIINNKLKSILLVIAISIILGLLKNSTIIDTNFKNIEQFRNYNIFLTIVYIIVCSTYLVKSIKHQEYIYSVISASIFFFIIKAIYAVLGSENSLADIKLVSVSITYIGFIVLIGGIICELLLSIKKNKILENELTIFKKIADESRHSCILIYDEFKNIRYINNKSKEYFKRNGYDNYDEISKVYFIQEDNLEKENNLEIKNHLLQIGYWKGTIEVAEKDITLSCSIQNIYIEGIKNKVVIFNDITERIRTKKYLMEYEKMKSQEQVRNEFFANISHELRTPLNIFYSTIQLLDMKNETNPKDLSIVYSNHKQCLKTNCQRMLRLINNIVDITKIDVGFIKPKFVNCDIVRLIEDITLSVINYAQPKEINIVFDTDLEEHIIKCDEDLIQRAMLNLLSNSIKFTNSNGNVNVKISVDNEWVHIIVKDDGIGIPIEVQGTIFDRFVQNDKSLTRLNEGSGIGLSIVQSAVKLNEGEIYLDSDGKNGTEFEILLPNKKLDGYDLEDKLYEFDVSKIELELSDIYELYN